MKKRTHLLDGSSGQQSHRPKKLAKQVSNRAMSGGVHTSTNGDGSEGGSERESAGYRFKEYEAKALIASVAPDVSNDDREGFSEADYLHAHPDVAAAIRMGIFVSGWNHYELYGKREGRRWSAAPAGKKEPVGVPGDPFEGKIFSSPAPEKSENEILIPTQAAPQSVMPSCFIEGLQISQNGGIFIVGWIDDSQKKLERLAIRISGCTIAHIEHGGISRVRRGDVEAALGGGRPHHYGFWTFTYLKRALHDQEYEIVAYVEGGASQSFKVNARVLDDVDLRNITLLYMANAEYFGNKQVLSIINLEHSLGRKIVDFNKAITTSLCGDPYVETFGSTKRKYKGTIVVCLYGRAEYQFLQNALYNGLPGIEDYEFIYVSNSPELSEQLLREAKISQLVYGIDQTIVLLPGNAGFGAANNVACRFASSNRFLIVNPDVFPKDRDWAKKHSTVIDNLPKKQTDIFGVPLYYDDGSLMHGGMYFDVDVVPSLDQGRMMRKQFVRVEHYAKGYPANAQKYLCSRAVPAVTGAFISIERKLFERISGFSEDYVFGHYEDADLCLKALLAGSQTWYHDIRMWHLEGKGSTRLPVHEGGSTVNRWLFLDTWSDIINPRMLGKNPDLSQFLVASKSESDFSQLTSNSAHNGSMRHRSRKMREAEL